MESPSSSFFIDAHINRYLSGKSLKFFNFNCLNIRSAVSVSIILYDHFITFDEEYKRVWMNNNTHRHHTKETLWKMAYLICRYASDCVLIVTAYSEFDSRFFFFFGSLIDRWTGLGIVVLSGSVELSIAVCSDET